MTTPTEALAQQPSAEPLTADQESRGMLLARLENMQQNGHTWLTITAVLALLNDCDMLASGHGGPPAGAAPLMANGLTTPTEAQRAAFEAFFADSRRNRGPSKRPTFDRLADGTYADDHTQRHWWTWQQGLAQQPSAEPMKGWKLNHTRKGPEDGMAEIGYLDPEDDHFSPIVTVDTDLYYQADQAMPLAVAILGAIAGAAPQQTAPQAPTVQPLADSPWRKLYRRAISEANGLTNYVEDRPELRGAERRLAAIEAEARTLAATPAPTPEE